MEKYYLITIKDQDGKVVDEIKTDCLMASMHQLNEKEKDTPQKVSTLTLVSGADFNTLKQTYENIEDVKSFVEKFIPEIKSLEINKMISEILDSFMKIAK